MPAAWAAAWLRAASRLLMARSSPSWALRKAGRSRLLIFATPRMPQRTLLMPTPPEGRRCPLVTVQCAAGSDHGRSGHDGGGVAGVYRFLRHGEAPVSPAQGPQAAPARVRMLPAHLAPPAPDGP